MNNNFPVPDEKQNPEGEARESNGPDELYCPDCLDDGYTEFGFKHEPL